jgi:hypothetical protein
MLRPVSSLHRYTLDATDGEIGSVHDGFIDDEFWILRYLVIDVGSWLFGRKVLLTPGVLGTPDWEQHRLPVKLTRSQVQESPDIDSDKPVSRQHEIELFGHYGWSYYWGVPPDGPVLTPLPPATEKKSARPGDPHLRSVRELHGYHIQASDGEIGHVDDFIVNDESWEIHYMVVATRNWLPGRKVLISPHWLVGRISWSERSVHVIMSCESVRNSPGYDPSRPLTPLYRKALHEHYRRKGYHEVNPVADIK